jgi:hypothetical protein
MILVLHLATHLNFKHCQVRRQRPYLMICFLTMRRLVQYGFSIQYRLVQYIQINTWAFPYWPGYHPESPILARDEMPGANMGRGMITRPIWKCPWIKLFITYFRHLEKRHPYWPETRSRPILARANMCLDMEMIL